MIRQTERSSYRFKAVLYFCYTAMYLLNLGKLGFMAGKDEEPRLGETLSHV